MNSTKIATEIEKGVSEPSRQAGKVRLVSSNWFVALTATLRTISTPERGRAVQDMEGSADLHFVLCAIHRPPRMSVGAWMGWHAFIWTRIVGASGHSCGRP